jgi:serine-aspartate repeat-containing protein C/D/E
MGLHDHWLSSAVAELARSPNTRLRSILSAAMLAVSAVVVATLVGAEEPSPRAADPANGSPAADQRSPNQRTWRLSIINGGQPRGDGLADSQSQDKLERPHNPFAEDVALKSGQWLFQDKLKSRFDGQPASLGRKGAIPVTGDFNGDGRADLGVFIDGEWFIDLNGNGRWDADDLWAKLGAAGDQPVVGDWDGDGKTDIGVWGAARQGDDAALAAEAGLPDADGASPTKAEAARAAARTQRGSRLLQRTSQGALRNDPVDHVFAFSGPADAVAVVGDFNGDGIDTIGLFSGGRWLLDTDGDGKWGDHETEHVFGGDGDVPVVGDLNGDGVDEIGIYRNGVWYFDTNGNHVLDEGDAELRLGGDRDIPVVGDFDGDGTDDIGVYRTGAAVHD